MRDAPASLPELHGRVKEVAEKLNLYLHPDYQLLRVERVKSSSCVRGLY